MPVARFTRAALMAVICAGVAAGLGFGAGATLATGPLPTLTLTMNGTAIVASGAQMSGAVEVRSIVGGESSGGPALFRLRPGVSEAQLIAELHSVNHIADLAGITAYASIVFDVQAPAGTSTVQTYLAAGNYVALDLNAPFPRPATTFTVAAPSDPAVLPTPGGTITAVDFAFHGASVFRDGELLRIHDEGYLPHTVFYAQLRSAADIPKAEHLLRSGQVNNDQGKNLTTSVKGQWTNFITRGAVLQQIVTQPPGVYMIISQASVEDGRPDYVLGMYRPIRILR